MQNETLSQHHFVLLLNTWYIPTSGCIRLVPSSVCRSGVLCDTTISTCLRGVCDVCVRSVGENRPRRGPNATIGQCGLFFCSSTHKIACSPPKTSECVQDDKPGRYKQDLRVMVQLHPGCIPCIIYTVGTSRSTSLSPCGCQHRPQFCFVRRLSENV